MSSSAPSTSTSTSSGKAKLDPRTFPRPPKLEKAGRHLQVKWKDTVIADTKDAYWVLETYHPPTYYLPRSSVQLPLTASSARPTHCEWKGRASYWDLELPEEGPVRGRIWSYEEPTARFRDLAGHVCFYAGPWDCFVDGERVEPQPGDFYGGWTTSDIDTAHVKGAPGTTWW